MLKKVNLGTTDAQVSEMCLGAMNFGSKTDTKTAARLMDEFLDAGGSFVDTSNNYVHWMEGCTGDESELFLGNYFKIRKNRNRFFLATKVGFDRKGIGKGLHADQITHWCDQSLKKLNTDYLDLYYAHCDDFTTPVEETMEAFNRLIRAGKVRFLGASNYYAWRLEEIQNVCQKNALQDYCCIQQRHSYLVPYSDADFGMQTVVNRELLSYIESRKIGLLAYSPLLSGAYDDPEKRFPPQYRMDSRLQTLKKLSNHKQVTCSQLVLAWLLQSSPSIIPLLGVSNSSQLSSNLKACDILLSTQELELLNKTDR